MWAYYFERYNDAIFIILQILIQFCLKTRLMQLLILSWPLKNKTFDIIIVNNNA